MQTTPLPDDDQLLALLKAKLDALARRSEISDPQELAHLSRQYLAVINALVELGYSQPFDVEDELLFVSKPDYEPLGALDFSAQNQPDVQLQYRILGSLIHEIRTPIAIIHTKTYLVTKLGELDHRQQDQLLSIDQQADRIASVVEQLAAGAFARLEALRKASDDDAKD